MKQKGQITLFIIIGLILLLAIGLLFFFSASVKEAPSLSEETTATAVQSYTQSCIDNVAKEAVLFISKNGGYYNLPVLSDTDLLLPYYFYNEQNIMVSKQDVELELASYMDNELFFCLKNYEAFEGVEITQGTVQTTVTIGDGNVLFNVFFPLTTTDEDATTTITDFSTSVEARLDTIYDIILKFMTIQEHDPSSICISCLTALGTERNVRIELYSVEDGVVEFSVIDEQVTINNENLVYTFLNKYPQYSCKNLPPKASEQFLIGCLEAEEKALNYTVAIETILDMNAVVGTEFTYTIQASGYNLSYSALTTLFTLEQTSGIISFIPTTDDIGQHKIWVHVTDPIGNEDYETFVLSIKEGEE